MSGRQGGGLFGGDRAADAGAGDLIARCLDGGASQGDVAELDRLVAGDPAVARALAGAARLESQLEVMLRAPADPLTHSHGGAPHGDRHRDRDQDRARAGDGPRWRRGAMVSTAGAVAVAAGLLVVWAVRPRQEARAPAEQAIAATAGAAARPAPDEAPAPPGRGQRLELADGSTAELRDDRSLLTTRLSTATAIDLVLAAGAARFEVVPRPDRRFRIWVDSTYVEVIGTTFTVERLATGVRVSVERGLVKVVSGAHEMRLSAGAAEMVPLAGPAPDRDPPGSRRERAERAERTRRDSRQESAAPPDEPGALLRGSEDARRSGRAEEASSLLRQLVDRHPRDPRAPYAAFMLGRVLLEELARPREAAAAFARVEILDPRTPLVEDALAREVESWARGGDPARARQRARDYLGRYPGGERAGEVRRHSRLE
jgi:transmembrane sensor